jgi:hypothetical protein
MDKVESLMFDLAEKLGYDVKKKPRNNQLNPELGKYMGLSSDELSYHMRELDAKIKECTRENSDIHVSVTKFMDDTAPNKATEVLYRTGKFSSTNVSVLDLTLNRLQYLKGQLEELHKAALESELSKRFVASYPTYKDKIANLKITQTTIGPALVVEVKRDVETRPSE